MKDVYLHLGAHKTGTSYIQRCLKESQDFFDKHESMLLLHRENIDESMVKDLMQWRKAEKAHKPPKSLDAYFQRIAQDDRDSCLLSYEGFLGTMDIGSSGTIYPHTQRVLDVMTKNLANQNIKVAFAVRSYSDYIESVYKWMLKKGLKAARQPFDEYLKGVDLQEISWVPVVNALRETFGEENVLVWSQEKFQSDSAKGNLNMLRFFYGDSVTQSDIVSDIPDANTSLSAEGMHIIRLIHGVIEDTSGLGKTERELLHRAIPRKIGPALTRIGGKKPVLFDKNTKDELYKKYLKDCKSLGIAV